MHARACSKKTSKAAAAAPKCLCSHPYKCDCGLRPERPSKGHKWDAEAKEWAGKGHKQKGSGNSVASTGDRVSKSGLSLREWEKSPSEILHGWCMDRGRRPCKFKNVEEARGQYRFRVIVPCAPPTLKLSKSAKAKAATRPDLTGDLTFVSGTAAGSELVGKEEVCLLALKVVMADMPLERSLPEPYKTDWRSMTATAAPPSAAEAASAKPLAPPRLKLHNKFVSAREREEFEVKVAVRKNGREKKEMAAKINSFWLDMTRSVRERVEKVVKSVRFVDKKGGAVGQRGDDAHQARVKELVDQGFRESHVRFGLSACSNPADCRAYLIRFLPEADLPDRYKPGDGGGNLGVVCSKKKGREADEGLSLSDEDRRLRAYGVPPADLSNFGSNAAASFMNVHDAFSNFANAALDPSYLSNDEALLPPEEELAAIAAVDPSYVTARISEDGLHFSTVALKSSKVTLVVEDVSKKAMLRSAAPHFLATSTQVAFIKGVREMLGEASLWEILSVAEEIAEEGEAEEDAGGSAALSKIATIFPASPAGSRDFAPGNEAEAGSEQNQSSSAPLPPSQRRSKGSRPSSFFSVPSSTLPPAPPPSPPPSISRQKASLPCTSFSPRFLSLLKQDSRVILVSGSTGCGKSTQIPQFLLEAYPSSKVCVTQPRRLAAVGLARRVSEEYGCSLGTTVGYAVKGDTCMCPSTRILFCTIGVLLRSLNEESTRRSLDWIVIDEVHERSLDTDILLGVVRKLLSDKTLSFRVVLMSATMQEDKFQRYFQPAPRTLQIPGRTFPVTDYFVRDALELTGYVPPKLRNTSKGDGSMASLIQRLNPMSVDYDFIARLVKSLFYVQLEEGGSILVFLPGLEEIHKTSRSISKICSSVLSDLKIFELHGGMKGAEQAKIFQSYKDKVKVVLSTNVAQTSITIPDCVVVIDSCLEKQR